MSSACRKRGIRVWTKYKQEISKFAARPPCSDTSFLESIGRTAESAEGQHATAVRRILASFGRVPPESITASDRVYPSLEKLPFYDSLDTIELALAMEEALEIEISDSEANRLFGYNALAESTIGEVIVNILHFRRATQ